MSLFPTTQWGLIVAAGGAAGVPNRDEALASLCAAYWYPLYVYARKRGHDAESARDATQGFFAHLLERNLCGVADPERGSFRAFLKAAFDHYAANERRKDQAQKRGAGVAAMPLDLATAEQRFAREERGVDGADTAYERQWASALLARALLRLESEMTAEGDGRRFQRLSPLLTGADDGAAYARIGVDLDLSAGAVKVAVHRLRKRFGVLLRDEVAKTVQSRERVDAELRHVLEVLGG